MEFRQALSNLDLAPPQLGEGSAVSTARSPINGEPTFPVVLDTPADLSSKVERAREAFLVLRRVPAPKRGEVIRRFGMLLRTHKEDLAALVTWESGKIFQEALGEVQEMIDICDFAVGLSRQLHGLTMATERAEHRMMEQWHPLGPIGVISAFNFPVAVWSWNAALAIVCGDPVVWKPSPQTPWCAIASDALLRRAARGVEGIPEGISEVALGGAELGVALADDRRLPLISATGSTEMGRAVAQRVAARLGRSLLELGGNNALIVAKSADMDLALRAVVFSAVGTAGQRCTSLRRLIVHRSRMDEMLSGLRGAYATLKVGDPFDPGVHVGPLVNRKSLDRMVATMALAKEQGGELRCGGDRVDVEGFGGTYVNPAVIVMPGQTEVMQEECFAPLLYVVPYDTLEEAIFLQNDVPQGLSSALFTESMREAESYLSAVGSDCGIANINVGTSGAEIGGAFGGEKDTGGGRESGSDAWKSYMRRTTNTINYGATLPLAQGIEFSVDGASTGSKSDDTPRK